MDLSGRVGFWIFLLLLRVIFKGLLFFRVMLRIIFTRLRMLLVRAFFGRGCRVCVGRCGRLVGSCVILFWCRLIRSRVCYLRFNLMMIR